MCAIKDTNLKRIQPNGECGETMLCNVIVTEHFSHRCLLSRPTSVFKRVENPHRRRRGSKDSFQGYNYTEIDRLDPLGYPETIPRKLHLHVT